MRTPWGLKFTSLKSGYRPFVITGSFPKFKISVVWEFWLHYINPMTYLHWIKHFCQRGYRGYSDLDCINTDGYLTYVMYHVLKDLQERKDWIPTSLLPNALEYTDEEYAKYKKIWDDLMQEMLDGLAASEELEEEATIPNGVYSDEPLEFEDLGNGMHKLKKTDKPRFNRELYLEWRKPLEKKRRRGALLLMKYWDALWL